jgi:O-antigen ligase
MLLTLVVSGTFQAIYGVSEILLGIEESLIFGLEVKKSATGSFVYRNHYANLLLMCAAAGIGLLVASLERNRNTTSKDLLRSAITTTLSSKALIRISIAIIIIGLVMSRSRMGNTAFFVAMSIVGFASLFLIKNKTKGLTFLVTSMFIVDLLIVSAFFGLDKVQERLTQTSLQQESRDEVIKDAINITLDFPLFGTGGGSFYTVFPGYKTHEVHAFYDHAHNDYLQMLIEYGFIYVLILGAMMFFLGYKALRPMRKRRRSILKGASFSCSMVILGMMIHMTVDFPLQAFSNASYFIVFLALSLVINSLKLKSRN